MQGKRTSHLIYHLLFYMQIADFGMSRDLKDDKCYTSSGGLIPIKWTAIEVS